MLGQQAVGIGQIAKETNVRFGSEADICVATSDVRFTPNSDHESGHWQTVMSALPPKADVCGALAHVALWAKSGHLQHSN
jgi:hypothetical protein